MFAIAIWDRLEKSLFLARDRMGIKPLYVWRRPEGLAFASEVKALRALPGGPSGVEPEAVVQYLAWGHVPAPLTITRGVECMMPATWLLWKGRLDHHAHVLGLPGRRSRRRRLFRRVPLPDPGAGARGAPAASPGSRRVPVHLGRAARGVPERRHRLVVGRVAHARGRAGAPSHRLHLVSRRRRSTRARTP